MTRFVLLGCALLLPMAYGAKAHAEASSAVTDSYTGGAAGSAAPSLLGGTMGACTPPPLAGTPASVGMAGDQQQAVSLGYYLQPSVSLSEFYSDNIDLAPTGSERSDYATILSPSLSGCTAGSRLRATFDYTAQAIHYARSMPHNKVYNYFNGNLNADLFAGHLFLDSNTSYNQAVIDPNVAYSSNNVYTTASNRTNVWTYNVSPYWKQSLGGLGLATLRYNYGRVVYTDPSLNGSQSWSKSFGLQNPPHALAWSWVLDWKSTRVKYDRTGQTQYFDNASLLLGYQLLHNLQLLAQGGVETEYLPDGSVKRYGSHYGSGGFRLKNAYSSLQVMYGYRYFGHTWMAHATYQTKSLNFAGGYVETMTNTPLLQTTQTASQPSALGPITPLNELQNTNAFVDKRAYGSVAYTMPRSQLTLSGYDDRRYYRPQSLGQDRSTGGAVDWKWQFNALTIADASFNRERYISRLTPEHSDFVNQVSAGVTRLLNPNARLRFALSRQSRRSVVAANNYTSNSATLQLTASF